MIKKRRHNTRGAIHNTTSRIKGKRSGPKHQILILEDEGEWEWLYYIGMKPYAISARRYKRLSDATRTARLFRGLLANADLCEIVPPPDHKYSGG